MRATLSRPASCRRSKSLANLAVERFRRDRLLEKGDASIENAELVISSITDDILRGTSNLRMLKNIRASCPNARVVLTSEHIPQALHFYEAGADFVYVPRLHSAPMLAKFLKQGLIEGFQALREMEIQRLSNRHEVLA